MKRTRLSHLLPALMILLIGAALRFGALLQVEHNIDRAWPLAQAVSVLHGGGWPVTSQQTSVLFANPAGMTALLLPALALTGTPLGAYIWVLLLNTLGLAVTYRAARVVAGPGAALVAMLLMAVNPWIIEYSRLTWVQGLLPLFVPAVAWFTWRAAQTGGARPLLGALVLLTMTTQTYLLAFALVAPVSVCLAWAWRRIDKRALLLGGLVFAICTGVYAAAALTDATAAARVSSFTASAPRVSSEALDHALRLVTGKDYAAAPANRASERGRCCCWLGSRCRSS
jgi:4-amino-4-deoxy-L-arabinose transferase-like glycosyltransferase